MKLAEGELVFYLDDHSLGERALPGFNFEDVRVEYRPQSVLVEYSYHKSEETHLDSQEFKVNNQIGIVRSHAHSSVFYSFHLPIFSDLPDKFSYSLFVRCLLELELRKIGNRVVELLCVITNKRRHRWYLQL